MTNKIKISRDEVNKEEVKTFRMSHETISRLKIEKKIVNDYLAISKRIDRIKFHADLITISDNYKTSKKDLIRKVKDEINYEIINMAADSLFEQESKFENIFLSYEPAQPDIIIECSDSNEKLFSTILSYSCSLLTNVVYDKYSFTFYSQKLKTLLRENDLVNDIYKILSNDHLDTVISFIEELAWQHFVLGEREREISYLISLINQKGYDYNPTEKDFILLDEAEKRRENRAGRKYDSTAPQEPIEKKVKELIKQKSAICQTHYKKREFINKQGKPKPTTIRDFIADNFPEIQGEIGNKALYNRVKAVTEKMQ